MAKDVVQVPVNVLHIILRGGAVSQALASTNM